MNWQTFISLIQKPNDSLFFVRSTQNETTIGKTISALLNSTGGTLIVGYDKINIHLTGYNQTDQWIDQFIETHFQKCEITSTFLFRANKKILLLDVKSSPMVHPYCSVFYQVNSGKIEPFTPTPPAEQPIKIKKDSLQTQANSPLNATPTPDTLPHSPDQLPSHSTQTLTPHSQPTSSNLNHNHSSHSLNLRQQHALSFVLDKGSIQNKQYRKLFNVSHKTAHVELAEMVQQDQLSIVGNGRSTCYQLRNQPEKHQKTDNMISKQQIELFINDNTAITQTMYAEEFNMDLADAINELQNYCLEGFLDKQIINNETHYVLCRASSYAS
jgi:predicted HTH transcriptional regulator